MRVHHILAAAVVAVVATSVFSACGGSTEGDEVEPTADRFAQARDIQACMARNGWEMELDEADGALVAEAVAADQEQQYQSDFTECLEEFPSPPLEMTEENAEAYYDGLVAVGECLSALGFSTPEPPSKSASVESMLNGAGVIDPLWDPFEPLFTTADVEAARRAMLECPAPQWGVR